MDKNKNPRQPNQGNRSGQPNQKPNKDQGHHRKNVPVASKPGNDKNQKSQQGELQRQESASGNTQTGEWQRPVTNQDEQRRPTNAGGNAPMSEEETEGDPGQERIKPYKNIGDDSEEVEKKTPSMNK